MLRDIRGVAAGAGRRHRVRAVPHRRGLGQSPRLPVAQDRDPERQRAACRLYHKMGRTLGAIDRFAYPGQPAEARLVWWKALASPDTGSS